MALNDNGTLYWLLGDHLGSTSLTLDANGNVTLAKSYEPYGSMLTSSGSASSMYGFTGEQTDNLTGLLFLRARYMQPRLGVFLSRDPWSGDALRPGSMNGFGYVEGDPVNGTDPSGKCEQNGDEECWGVYEQIVHLCPECADLRPPNTSWEQPLYTARIDYLYSILKKVRTGWRPYFATSIEEAIRDEALRFGVPWQVVAGLLESERQIDTDWFWDPVQNSAYSLLPQLADTDSNPGPGIGNIHILTAKSTAQYFLDRYSECWSMRLDIHPGDTNAVAAWRLVNDFFNVRVMAGHIRQLADYRFGSNGQPNTSNHANLAEWTIRDAVAIWHGYRYGVPDVSPPGQGLGFKDLETFQNRAKDLDKLLEEGLVKGNDAYDSIHKSIPIFEKYFSMPNN